MRFGKKLAGMVAAGAAAVLMLSGFDSAMTVSELQEKTKGAMAQATSMSANMQGTATANLKLSQGGENGATMDVPINGIIGATYQFSLDPLQMEIAMDFSGEAMGQGANGKMEVYLLEREDGMGYAYMGSAFDSDQMEWEANEVDSTSITQMKEMIRGALSGDPSTLDSLSQNGQGVDTAAIMPVVEKYQQMLAEYAQIAPASVTVNDKDCYQITASLPGDVLYQIMADIAAAAPQSVDSTSLQMMQAFMGGIKMNVDTFVDTQTFLPVSGKLDLGESDFSAIGDLMVSSMMGEGSGASAQIDVSALNMTCDFTWNEPVTVTVPPEAMASQISTDTTDTGAGPENVLGGLLTGGTDDASLTGGTDDSSTGSDDGAVMNPDGSYHLEYESWDGSVKKADITPPEGLRLSYGTGDYISFANDDYSYDVTYSLFSGDTPEETVESSLDVSFMESDSSYTDVKRTEVSQTALPDGRTVCYGFKGYTYGGYQMGSTECAVQAGDTVVSVSIEKEDAQRNAIEASEEEVKTYTALVNPAS